MRPPKAMAVRLRELADQYARHVGAQGIAVVDAVDWARGNGNLDERLPPDLSREVWCALMAAALQGDTIKVDGRVVRVRLCVSADVPDEGGEPDTVVQRTLWAHVDEAPRDFIQRAFEQRHRGVARDVLRLQVDLEYANRRLRARGLRPIQMNLNFGPDDRHSQAGA